MDRIGEYRIESFPSSRMSTIDIGAVGRMKHRVFALLELDVTDARQMVAERKRQGQHISFNAWLIKCVSKAVEEHRIIQGVRTGKRGIAIFEDIDISIMIERVVQQQKVPLPYVIRQTDKKSVLDISGEIKAGQRQPIEHEGNYVLGEEKNAFLMKVYYSLPGIIRRLVWRVIINNPFLTKQHMGTVMMTFVGMMGRLNGWVIPVGVHPLCIAVGSIIKKPGVVDNKIEIREYLYMTVLVDHDVIDGAPAARAIAKLTKLVESGYGL